MLEKIRTKLSAVFNDLDRVSPYLLYRPLDPFGYRANSFKYSNNSFPHIGTLGRGVR